MLTENTHLNKTCFKIRTLLCLTRCVRKDIEMRQIAQTKNIFYCSSFPLTLLTKKSNHNCGLSFRFWLQCPPSSYPTPFLFDLANVCLSPGAIVYTLPPPEDLMGSFGLPWQQLLAIHETAHLLVPGMYFTWTPKAIWTQYHQGQYALMWVHVIAKTSTELVKGL